MTRRFMEDPTSDGDVVQPDRYTVHVVDARAIEGKDFVWLDLRIVGGPDDGRVVSCSLNMPDDDASRGAKFYFKKKIRGFLPYLTQVWLLPDEDQADALAEAVLDKRIDALLSIDKTDGPYKGSQQLEESFQTDIAVAPAVHAVPAAGEPPVTPEAQPNGQSAVEVGATVNAGVDTNPPF